MEAKIEDIKQLLDILQRKAVDDHYIGLYNGAAMMYQAFTEDHTYMPIEPPEKKYDNDTEKELAELTEINRHNETELAGVRAFAEDIERFTRMIITRAMTIAQCTDDKDAERLKTRLLEVLLTQEILPVDDEETV